MKDDEVGDDVIVWRYMTFTKFIAMLNGPDVPSLYFTRPFAFDDRWEGKYPPSYARNTKKYANEKNWDFAEFKELFDKRLKQNRYGYFVNCWHINDHESDAMWRLYGLSPEGVAIQSTAGAVRECLRPHNDGAVIYYDPIDEVKHEGGFGPPDLLYKRKAFDFEKEFRAWFSDDSLLEQIEQGDEIDERKLTRGMSVPITKMDLLIKKVVVAPGACDSFLNLVRNVCEAYRKTWLGGRVERSYSDRLHASFCHTSP